MKLTAWRRLSLCIILVLVVVGIIFSTGSGTPSSFGWGYISTVCPLGAIEVFLATRLLIPRTLISLILMVAVIMVFGKVFCAWVCPIPPLRHFFVPKKKLPSPVNATNLRAEENHDLRSTHCTSYTIIRHRFDSRHIVLGGALLSSAVFGAPVFCLICPVGLTFATLIAFWRWVGFDELSVSLVVFPIIIVLEIFVLRKWCLKICPLGAVMSLLSIPNRLFRPKVDESRCLRNKGIACTTCVEVCEECLDPHYAAGMHECTKCGECIDQCPSAALQIRIHPRYAPRVKNKKTHSKSIGP
jgi:ferredoxin-type protein NapH